MNSKVILVALGGNALERDGDTSVAAQQTIARETARQLIPLIQKGHTLAIVHGNGPQVGAILLRTWQPDNPQTSIPLNTAVAMSQGEIGYWLQQAFQNELAAIDNTTGVATIITQVLVDNNDPAFQNPSKPVGPFYPDQKTAEAAAEAGSFKVKEDAGRGWRRVVPSPQPIDIIEKDSILTALHNRSIVIAAGGGGIPVVRQSNELIGVDAVIDKDASARLLAETIDADTLLILTAVDAVSINYRQPDEMPLRNVTTAQLRQYIADNQFAPGSMLPKVEAAVAFADFRPGNVTIITSPDRVQSALEGGAGTRITRQ